MLSFTSLCGFFAPLADFLAGSACLSLNQAHHCLSIPAHASCSGRNPSRIFCSELLPSDTHHASGKSFLFNPKGHIPHVNSAASYHLPTKNPEQQGGKMLIQEFLWRSSSEKKESWGLMLWSTSALKQYGYLPPTPFFFPPFWKWIYVQVWEPVLVLTALHRYMHIPCIPPAQAELPETCKNWRVRLHITKIISKYCWESAGIFVRLAVWRLKMCQVKLINHLLIAARSIMRHCWEKSRAHQREHQLWKNLRSFLNGKIDRILER